MANGGATPTAEAPVPTLLSKIVDTGLALISAKQLAKVDYEYRQPLQVNADVSQVKSAPTDGGVLLQPGQAVIQGLTSNPVALVVILVIAVASVIVISKAAR